jgi:F-type H+-transporting ATPase subunit b
MAELGFHWQSLVVYLVNFTILLAILYAVGYKPIMRMLDQRSDRIRDSLDQADRLQKESTELQADMERQLQEARRQGQTAIDEARVAAERFREEERLRAQQEATSFIERARVDIQRERDNAVDEVRQQFADLAITAAERVIRRSLDSDAHKDLIDQVLEESEQLDGGS